MAIETDIKSPLLEDVSEIPSETTKKQLRSSKNGIFGAILAFISGVIFVGNNTVIQWLKLDFADIIFVRSFIQLTLIGSLCFLNNLSLLALENEMKTT